MSAAPLVQTSEVSREIRSEICSDPRIVGVDIAAEFDGSDVTLKGTVTSYAARLIAAEAALRQSGCAHVHNLIEVKIPPVRWIADREVAEAVRFTFKWNSLLPSNCLDCVVVDGWVLLTGTVLAGYQKLEAENAIAHISGIRGIVNDINVSLRA